MNRTQNSTTYPFQVVSPFLTGRICSGKVNGIDNWDDDNIDPTLNDNLPNGLNNKIGDAGIEGKYYVNDPSNKANKWQIPFPGLEHTKWEFNDLNMRRALLCDILESPCNNPASLLDLIKEINHIPLPPGSH